MIDQAKNLLMKGLSVGEVAGRRRNYLPLLTLPNYMQFLLDLEPEEIKTVTKSKHWGIGLQAGYGVALHKGQVYPAPYIGVGLSYSIINW